MNPSRSMQYGAQIYSRESATSPTAETLAVIVERQRIQ
jgi:hypothetical protein